MIIRRSLIVVLLQAALLAAPATARASETSPSDMSDPAQADASQAVAPAPHPTEKDAAEGDEPATPKAEAQAEGDSGKAKADAEGKDAEAGGADPYVVPDEATGRRKPEIWSSWASGPDAALTGGYVPKLQVPIDLFGYFWVDTGYMKRTNAREGQYDQDAAYMQGRFVLGAAYTRTFGSTFALAKTELIGFVNEFTKSQFEAHVLDAYLMIGQPIWDLQVGRFLAWEVYYRGAGIELYTPEETGALDGPALYWLDTTRGFVDEAGQAAFHLYPFESLGIEVAGVYGQQSNQNRYGIRPVVDFHMGGFQLVAGYEYFKQLPQTVASQVKVTSQGYAARLEWHVPVVRIGVEAARESVEYIDIDGLKSGEKTYDNTTAGAFLDVNLWQNNVIGLGYHHTFEKNLQGEEDTHDRLFVAYVRNLPIKGLSVKLVYGFALAHIQDVDVGAEWDNRMNSLRLRLLYTFS